MKQNVFSVIIQSNEKPLSILNEDTFGVGVSDCCPFSEKYATSQNKKYKGLKWYFMKIKSSTLIWLSY